MLELKKLSLQIAQTLAKLGYKLAKNWYISFLAFLAISREKWVIFSRISREIQNARNVPVYSKIEKKIEKEKKKN